MVFRIQCISILVANSTLQPLQVPQPLQFWTPVLASLQVLPRLVGSCIFQAMINLGRLTCSCCPS